MPLVISHEPEMQDVPLGAAVEFDDQQSWLIARFFVPRSSLAAKLVTRWEADEGNLNEFSCGWSPPARANWVMKENFHHLEHVALVTRGESKSTGLKSIDPVYES